MYGHAVGRGCGKCPIWQVCDDGRRNDPLKTMAHPVSMLLSLLAVIAADGMESSADPISASSSVASWFYSQEGSWTDRLGLRFRDDCQENTGVGGIFLWIWSWARRQGQQRSGHCESREMRCGAGSKMTGLQVRYGRMEHGDRDLYDFRPRCGESWQPWLGMKFPREGEADRLQVEAGVCTAGTSVTGIQVMRGRDEWADTDYFNFRLRCAKSWLEQPLGLAFNGLRETRSATCPSGAAIAGLRVHRGFQDWGDMDTYEVSATPLDAMLPMPCSGLTRRTCCLLGAQFQLFCTLPAGKTAGSAADASGDGPSSGGRGRTSRKRGGGGGRSERGSEAPPHRQRHVTNNVHQRQLQAGKAQNPSAFGSRAAGAAAAADEVRAELRAAAARMEPEPLKDEL